jgi:two-component system chemotaxis response regulator CheY
MTQQFAGPYEGVAVLIVEDEPNTRKLIKSLLLQIGIRSILEAADGKTGIDEVIRARPTLVLCDVHMQPVDGRAFLARLRSFKVASLAATPVVFLTGDAQTDTVLFAKEHRVNGYLVKPVSLADLRSRIDAVLKGLAPA